MNDIERKVTEFLKDDAADADRPAQMPDGMTKRIRRRQTRTALMTGVAALAIIAVSVAGFRAFLPLATDKQTPAGPGFGDVPTTTAALSWATITYPSDWHLVELQGDARYGIDASVLLLTNYEEVASGHSRSCPKVFSVDHRVGLILGHDPSAEDPQRLSPGTIPVFDCWADPTPLSPENGYSATMWTDDLATQADKDALQAAFDSLLPPENPPDAAGTSLTSPADVLFAGGTGSDAWRIVSYPLGDAGARIEIRASTAAVSSMMASVGGGRKSGFGLAFPRWPTNGGGPTGSQDLGPAVLYGTVVPGQESVAIRTGDGSMLPVQLRPMPAYDNGLEAFAIPMESLPPDATVVVTQGEGGPEMNVPLASLAVFSSSGSSSSDDPESMLQTALLAADTWYVDRGTYEGFTPKEASKIDPSLNWTDRSMNRRGDTVDITFAEGDGLLLNAYAASGKVACSAHGAGDTSIELVEASTVAECTPIAAAQTQLRYAIATAKTFFTDGDTYDGLTPEKAAAYEPTVTFNTSQDAKEGEVSIRDVSAQTVLLVTRASNGDVYCLADDALAGTTYGTTDAQTVAECTLASWPALPSSPAVPKPTPSEPSSASP